ncbi:hypothetical protein LAV73_08430 [Lysinibacillus xylanilyticus]|uniref:hypothetical protein n=1 Tax=Lysinibacillus xylanilyticus TaxID=582475 RepID=UPI002B241D60|nr:hypothetical protein [Lysinibacillus xylanilyticus]MEB2280029.1 hypothetical protein [Lysinibacillus xylanilyticus]
MPKASEAGIADTSKKIADKKVRIADTLKKIADKKVRIADTSKKIADRKVRIADTPLRRSLIKSLESLKSYDNDNLKKIAEKIPNIDRITAIAD